MHCRDSYTSSGVCASVKLFGSLWILHVHRSLFVHHMCVSVCVRERNHVRWTLFLLVCIYQRSSYHGGVVKPRRRRTEDIQCVRRSKPTYGSLQRTTHWRADWQFPCVSEHIRATIRYASAECYRWNLKRCTEFEHYRMVSRYGHILLVCAALISYDDR